MVQFEYFNDATFWSVPSNAKIKPFTNRKHTVEDVTVSINEKYYRLYVYSCYVGKGRTYHHIDFHVSTGIEASKSFYSTCKDDVLGSSNTVSRLFKRKSVQQFLQESLNG